MSEDQYSTLVDTLRVALGLDDFTRAELDEKLEMLSPGVTTAEQNRVRESSMLYNSAFPQVVGVGTDNPIRKAVNSEL